MKDIKQKKNIENCATTKALYVLDRKYFYNTYDRFNNLKSTHVPNETIFK